MNRQKEFAQVLAAAVPRAESVRVGRSLPDIILQVEIVEVDSAIRLLFHEAHDHVEKNADTRCMAGVDKRGHILMGGWRQGSPWKAQFIIGAAR